jgi:hypothetical protein
MIAGPACTAIRPSAGQRLLHPAVARQQVAPVCGREAGGSRCWQHKSGNNSHCVTRASFSRNRRVLNSLT